MPVLGCVLSPSVKEDGGHMKREGGTVRALSHGYVLCFGPKLKIGAQHYAPYHGRPHVSACRASGGLERTGKESFFCREQSSKGSEASMGSEGRKRGGMEPDSKAAVMDEE